MVEPTGYTGLDLVGFSDKGSYSSSATYVKNDLVRSGGSMWRCKVDDTTGIAPGENTNWTLFISGGSGGASADMIADTEVSPAASAHAVGDQFIYNDVLYTAAAAIAIGDTLVVNTNIVVSDTLVEQISDKVNTADIANNLTTTAAGKVLDARQGKVLGDEVEALVNVYGSKNLLLNNAVTQTINGVTFTVNSDGSVIANGTATGGNASLFIEPVNSPYKTNIKGMVLSGCTGGSDETYSIRMEVSNDGSTYAGSVQNFDGDLVLSGYNYFGPAHIIVRSGVTVNNVLFKPMIRDARIKDDTYVPYAMTNKALTDSVAQLNSAITKNNIEAAVDLTGYTNDKYTVPDDGYVTVGSNTSSTVAIRVYSGSNNNYFTLYACNGMSVPCFVRKGMKLMATDMTGNSYYARYFKLI